MNGERAGLIDIGCMGILEALHKRRALPEIREVFVRLLAQDFRIDPEIENGILGYPASTVVGWHVSLRPHHPPASP